MLTITRRVVGVSLVATLLAVAGFAWAGTPEARADLKRQEARITKIEGRLAAIQPDGQKAEALAASAKTMLGLSRRFLGADNATAAQFHADIAERFVALAEGKAVQQ